MTATEGETEGLFAVSEREGERVFPREAMFGPSLKEVRGGHLDTRVPGPGNCKRKGAGAGLVLKSWQESRAQGAVEQVEWGEPRPRPQCATLPPTAAPLRDSARVGRTVLYLLHVGKFTFLL